VSNGAFHGILKTLLLKRKLNSQILGFVLAARGQSHTANIKVLIY
jgi:hypothetical protein